MIDEGARPCGGGSERTVFIPLGLNAACSLYVTRRG
jgi:hypothetical protein